MKDLEPLPLGELRFRLRKRREEVKRRMEEKKLALKNKLKNKKGTNEDEKTNA